MKIWRLVSGILSIILFALVSLQSCAAGVVNSIEENGQVSGSAGMVVSIMLLTGGITSVVTRNGSKGGCIATMVLYGIGAVCGYLMAGNFGDLYIWATWCLVCAVLSFVTIRNNISKNEEVEK